MRLIVIDPRRVGLANKADLLAQGASRQPMVRSPSASPI